MLEFLIGKIHKAGEFEIVVDLGNYGFKALTPSTFDDGKEYKVYTKLTIKDEDIKLYAFKLEIERTLFLKLMNINGIGVKQSLRLLREYKIDEFLDIIESKDVNRLTKVQGIGKKLAQRIIFELSGKLEMNDKSDTEQEIIETINALGYPVSQIKEALKSIDISKYNSLEIAVKEILKYLSKNKIK